MYGSQTAAAGTAGGGILATTGVGIGSMMLAGIGLIFLGVALIGLFRTHHGRP